MLGLVFALAAATPACDAAAAERQLAAMHAAIIDHHLTDDVEAWMAMEDARIVASGEGVIVIEDESRAAERRDYLAAAEFSYYRDMVPPIVRVSGDCSLGWVIAQVEGAGGFRGEGGEPQSFTFQSSWIELYEQRDGRWRVVGNVSNMAPPPD